MYGNVWNCHAVGGPRRNLSPGPCTAATDGPPETGIVATGGSPAPWMVAPKDCDVQVLYDGGPYWNTDSSIGTQLLT